MDDSRLLTHKRVISPWAWSASFVIALETFVIPIIPILDPWHMHILSYDLLICGNLNLRLRTRTINIPSRNTNSNKYH